MSGIDMWLKQQERLTRKLAIAVYGAEMAGTTDDLDEALESAAIEHIVDTGEGGTPGSQI